MAIIVDELLRSVPRLWRGSGLPGDQERTLPSGFAELDAALPGGGWPLGAVVELLHDAAGIGELRLLLPLLQRLTHTGNHVLLIDPPYAPNAVSLQACGMDLEQVLLARPATARDALWTAEQALRNPACGAVLMWAPARGKPLGDDHVRRLQVAAQEGQSTLFLYRAGRRRMSQWAALRLALLPAEEGVLVSVLKAVGTHQRPQVTVTF